MAKLVIILISGIVVLLTRSPNHAPTVTIRSPENNSAFNAGSRVHYAIVVTDQEDGDSRYDEINTKEVMLEVKCVRDQKEITRFQNKKKLPEPAGLVAMRTSNCFNCHGFERKELGPSFRDIGRKYKFTQANTTQLSNSIGDGSSGVWGNTPMPKHPELSRNSIKNMVQWILEFSSHPEINYYIGTDGYFDLPEDSFLKKGVCLLKATYTDHGVDSFRNRLTGENEVMIKFR